MWPFRRRSNKLPHNKERVLILGASSGVGRALAHQYAAAGARLCVVARGEEALTRVVDECKAYRCVVPSAGRHTATPGSQSETNHGDGDSARKEIIISVPADFTVVEDMVTVRTKVQEAWGGLDTLVVCAGVGTLRPFLESAGVDMRGRTYSPPEASSEGIAHVVDVATAAARGNYIGPVIAAATFIPLVATSSVAPAVVLISSLGAVVPPPTLSLYSATKAASLMLYQVLAAEHPHVAFTLLLPGVFRGERFFSTTVDGGRVRTPDPRTHGLRHEDVARRCVQAVDRGKQEVFMPALLGRFAHFGYWLFPSLIVRVTRRMYDYKVE